MSACTYQMGGGGWGGCSRRAVQLDQIRAHCILLYCIKIVESKPVWKWQFAFSFIIVLQWKK